MQPLDRFYLEDNTSLDKQVDAQAILETQPVIIERNCWLTFDMKSAAFKVTREHDGVDGLKKPRSETLVKL